MSPVFDYRYLLNKKQNARSGLVSYRRWIL